MRSDFDRMNESSVLTFEGGQRLARRARPLSMLYGTTVKTWISYCRVELVGDTEEKFFLGTVERTKSSRV